MSRLTHAWRAMEAEQRLAALASLGLLVTMFFPWYGLQSLNRKTGVIYSHNISAFGDVSFVEAAVFLVAAGVSALLLGRAEGRDFRLPGGDGTIVLVAGAWAALLIFYRVFSRPAGDGYPVGIEWGFFLAFVAAGTLAFAGWRMRAGERPEPPLLRGRGRDRPRDPRGGARPDEDPFAEQATVRRQGIGEDPGAGERLTAPVAARARPSGPRTAAQAPERPPAAPDPLPAAPARAADARKPAAGRPRFPPAPAEQMSFEDPPPSEE
jgi:hypothetical protein